ncbi:hypothetical protein N9C70_01715 [Flavobacteriales bacterium]|nr:hypothetical protein [Flavobacteriales bacterium]
MKAFVQKCSIALMLIAGPYVALIIQFAVEDPFRLNTYPPYVEGHHHINRGVVTTNGYLRHTDLDAIIMGNSRSISLRCDDWTAYQFEGEGGSCFHFDASGDNLFGIQQKARLIRDRGNTIQHALIVIDDHAINAQPGSNDFPYVRHPIFNELSSLKFYWVFIKQYLNPIYQLAHLTNNSSLGTFWVQAFSYHECEFNSITGDYISAKEFWIKKDSAKYYSQNWVFDDQPDDSFYDVNHEQLQSLTTTVRLLESIGAECTVLFQPRFSKTHPSIAALNQMTAQLTETKIIDASHFDKITNQPGYWYERSHFRPIAGRMIIDAIESGELKPHALQQP